MHGRNPKLMTDLDMARATGPQSSRNLRRAVSPDRHRLTVAPREAATMLGVDVSFVYTWVRTGELAHFMAGRAIKIPVEGLDEFIRQKSGLTRQRTSASKINRVP